MEAKYRKLNEHSSCIVVEFEFWLDDEWFEVSVEVSDWDGVDVLVYDAERQLVDTDEFLDRLGAESVTEFALNLTDHFGDKDRETLHVLEVAS